MNPYGYDGELVLRVFGGFCTECSYSLHVTPKSAWTVSVRDTHFHTSCGFAKSMTKMIDGQWLLLSSRGSSLFV